MSMRILVIIPVFVLATGCGGDKTPPPAGPSTPPPGGAAAAPADHGAPVALGAVTLAGRTFSVIRHGPLTPGKEGAFGAVQTQGPAMADTALYLWVEDQGGNQVSAPAQGTLEGSQWHFHATLRKDAKAAVRAVLRARAGALDERAPIGLRPEIAPQHEGVAAPLLSADGKPAGFLELKLHDDKGDLELWLATDPKIAEPLDLPAATVVKAKFPALNGREIELRVRNQEKNDDEDGQPNLRQGKTNYFVFPGATGADAKWLAGSGFASPVVITFGDGAGAFRSEEFLLVPHSHGAGHTH